MIEKCLGLLCMVVVCYCGRPSYIGCQSGSECGKEACCVIGMGRFSIPQCRPSRDLGEECRPYGSPVNTTLHYPDGVSIHLEDVYYIHCPCQRGLTCAENGDSPVCVEALSSNHVYDYSGEHF